MKRCIFLLGTLVACASASAAWEYEPIADKMSGKTGVRADVTSDNQLSFDFPYQGQNQGFLTVRQHPQYGLGVIVSINKGQMLCNVYDCKVSVKFDDAKPVTYSGSAPSDHSSVSIFISDKAKFIAGAKKAKKILIQFSAFRNGSHILEFSTPQALEWPHN